MTRAFYRVPVGGRAHNTDEARLRRTQFGSLVDPPIYSSRAGCGGTRRTVAAPGITFSLVEARHDRRSRNDIIPFDLPLAAVPSLY